MITYVEFLERAVNEGILAARRDYARREERAKLEGSIAGFEACRRKTPAELALLLEESGRKTEEARIRFHLGEISIDEYWGIRCKEAEIEWISNVVSVVLVRDGHPPITPPTVRAAMTAAAILEEPAGGDPKEA